jgi:hypothetical protein
MTLEEHIWRGPKTKPSRHGMPAQYIHLDAAELEDAVTTAARRITGIGEWNDDDVKIIAAEVVSEILRASNTKVSHGA